MPSRRALAWERRVAARLPLGPDGIVVGAGPIALDATGDRVALILHGFGDTPESVTTVARRLHAGGWTVRAPLLAGHGRDLPTFARSRATDWVDSARDTLTALRATGGRVAIIGQSLGAALAVVLAAELARDATALVLLAPYLGVPANVRWGARLAPLLALATPYLSSNGGARSIHDPVARAASRGPGVVTPGLVRELARAVAWGRTALPHVGAPTLVIASRQDNRIAPHTVADVVARIGSAVADAPRPGLVWLDRCGHVIAADHERDTVAEHTAGWLDAHVPAADTARARRASSHEIADV